MGGILLLAKTDSTISLNEPAYSNIKPENSFYKSTYSKVKPEKSNIKPGSPKPKPKNSINEPATS